MTDFYPMGTAAPQQEPLTVNQGYNTNYMPGPGSNVIYTTPCNCIIGVIVTVFFYSGNFLIYFYDCSCYNKWRWKICIN